MYHKLTVYVKSRYQKNLFPSCCFGDKYHKYHGNSINTLQISFIFYIKAWFGVSKYCSTSSLRTAIGWRKSSEFHLSTSAEPKCILDPLLPIPLHLPVHSRRNMGLWYSNGLHHLWCCTPSCYTINNSCTCRLCGERQPTKSHLLSCRTSTLASHIVITPVNVNKVVNVLYVI